MSVPGGPRDGMAPPPRGNHLAADAPPLTALGSRVRVAPVAKGDLEPYRRAVEGSRARLAAWNPVDPSDLERHLRFQSSGHRTLIVHALEPDDGAGHDIVGRVNVTNVIRGRALSATLGYDAYDPYAGRGLFAEGLRLVVDLALAPEPRGMGLHRVEANVQPGNTRSAGLLRSLGFRRRGAWPSYLWLPDGSGGHAWRDHVAYGVTAPEWPAPAYAADPAVAAVVLLPAAEHGDAGALVAAELGVPWLSGPALAALGVEAAREVVAPAGGVVMQDGPEATGLAASLGWQSLVVRAGEDEAHLIAQGDRPAVVGLALRARAAAHRAG